MIYLIKDYMERVKNFLTSNSSTTVSVICSKLEIPYINIFPLIESALQELGHKNYKIIYSINTGEKILTFTEKDKKEIEEKYGKLAKIWAIQRSAEDLDNLYNNKLRHKEQLIREAMKNETLYLPRFFVNGGLVQQRREYSSQELNFRPSNTMLEVRGPDEEAGSLRKIGYVVKEEDIRSSNESAVLLMNKTIDAEMHDCKDIIKSKGYGGSTVETAGKPITKESSSGDEVDFLKNKDNEAIPKKRKNKTFGIIEKRVYRENMNQGSDRTNKMMQHSLKAFFYR